MILTRHRLMMTLLALERDVKYIGGLKSNGTQYIDTLLNTAGAYTIECYYRTTATNNMFFGAGDSSPNYACIYNNNYTNAYVESGTAPRSTISVSNNIFHKYKYEIYSGRLYIDDVLVLSRTAVASASKVWLMKAPAYSSWASNSELLWAKIYDNNGNVLRDFKPAIIEDKACMYDTKNDGVYYSASSDDFDYLYNINETYTYDGAVVGTRSKLYHQGEEVKVMDFVDTIPGYTNEIYYINGVQHYPTDMIIVDDNLDIVVETDIEHGYVSICDVMSGADMTKAYTKLISGSYYTNQDATTAWKLFDGVKQTGAYQNVDHCTLYGILQDIIPYYISSTAKEVTKAELTVLGTGAFGVYVPQRWKVVYSDDGITWNDATSYESLASGVYEYSKTFTSVGAHRYWGVEVNNTNSSREWMGVSELNFYEYI